VTDAQTKIFGIGLSRTGTLSLTSALEMLGIEAVHYPNDVRTQRQLKEGQYSLSLLERVQAVTDIPVSPFYAQFDAVFPKSKFILTTRSTEEWLHSVERHFQMYVDHQRDTFDDFVLACVYGTLRFDAGRFRYVKEVHEENVRRYFSNKPRQLLIVNFLEADSWEPLCAFLDLPVPDEPFPHRNKALLAPARRRRLRTAVARRFRWRR
jgi:Sulfotransferase domain